MPVAEAIVGDGGWRVVMDVKKEEENGLDYKYLRERRFDGRGCIVHLNSKDDGVDYCKMPLTMAFDGTAWTNHLSLLPCLLALPS